MTVFGDVFDSLTTMSQSQLLLGFVACIGYTVAQGSLVSARGRGIAAVASFAAALGFAFHSGTWAHGTVLMAFAVTGFGAFAAIVWLAARVLGLARADAKPVDLPAAVQPDGVAHPSVARPRPLRSRVPSA
jgi:hypothetical protein